jgi:hypothetical protein
MEGRTENYTPEDNFTPRGQNSPLGDNFAPGGQSLPRDLQRQSCIWKITTPSVHSLVRLENRNIFFCFEKRSSLLPTMLGVVNVKSEVVGLPPWLHIWFNFSLTYPGMKLCSQVWNFVPRFNLYFLLSAKAKGEVMLYFQDPQELLSIFADLEDENLALIQVPYPNARRNVFLECRIKSYRNEIFEIVLFCISYHIIGSNKFKISTSFFTKYIVIIQKFPK